MVKFSSKLSSISIAVAVALFTIGCGSSSDTTTNESVEQHIVSKIPNKAPVAADALTKTSIGQQASYTLTATDSDGDQVSFKKLSDPQNGSITYFDKKSGTFTYVPDDGFTGSDKFTYSVEDGASSCPAKTVTIEVGNNQDIEKPNTPTNLDVTSCSCTAAKLSWDDNSGNEDGFEVYVNELDSDGDVVKSWLEFVKDADETYAVVWGLKPNTRYRFDIKAKNEAGSSDALSQTFTTVIQDRKPEAPSELTASTGDHCIRLNWEDNADNETGYEIYKDGELLKTIDPNCACTVIGDLDEDTTYTFDVVAINGAGSSSRVTISSTTKKDEGKKPNPQPKPKKNKAPKVTTDGNKVINKGDSVLIKAKATDSDGTIKKYEWREGDKIIATTATLNYSPKDVGVYNIIVTVTDDDGATASSAVKVVVKKKKDPKPKDNKKPKVSAGENVTTEVNKPVTLKATASDEDGTIVRYVWKEGDTVVGTTSTINYTPTTVAEHRLILTVTDNDGATSQDYVLVTATAKPESKDTIKPVIKLKGSSTVTITEGSAYNDAGATASDNKDGDITSRISKAGTVKTNKAGTYKITFNVSDAAGNKATEVTRTVIVKAKVSPEADKVKPVIKLKGSSTVTITKGSAYNDAGATANDDKDGDITAKIVKSGSVDTSKAGTYTIKYNVSDKAGNRATEVTRTVIVKDEQAPIDNTKPVIKLKGSNVTITEGDAYNDAGATASDDTDGDITAKIVKSGTVDNNKAGTYTIKYNVSDVAGNAAVEVTRTVTVKAKAVVDPYADWVSAKDSEVHDLSTEFKGNTVKVLIASNNQIGEDALSINADFIFGKINGENLSPDFLINQNYSNTTKFIVRVYNTNGKVLGTSQEITYVKGSEMDFGNIAF